MLKTHLDIKRDKSTIEFEGNLEEAVASVSFIIKDLHDHFAEADALGANLFKWMMQAIISDDASPVWDGIESLKDGIKKVEIRLPDCLRPEE